LGPIPVAEHTVVLMVVVGGGGGWRDARSLGCIYPANFARRDRSDGNWTIKQSPLLPLVGMQLT
jgi:hypothetical protein